MISKKVIITFLICFSFFNLSYAENVEKAASPFKDSEIKVEKTSPAIKIANIEIAKAAGITEIQKGFPNAKWNGKCTQSWVRQKLQAGTPLVAHVRNHFVVIKGIDNNGNIIINDPAKGYVEET